MRGKLEDRRTSHSKEEYVQRPRGLRQFRDLDTPAV
jgi:hypothetical protein